MLDKEMNWEGYFLADIFKDDNPIAYNQLFFMDFVKEKIGENNQFSIMFPGNPFHIKGKWVKDSGFVEVGMSTFCVCSEFHAQDFAGRYIILKPKSGIYNVYTHINFMDKNTVARIFEPSHADVDRQLSACKSILLAANQIEDYIRQYGKDNVLINENLKAVKYFARRVQEIDLDYLFWASSQENENIRLEMLKLDKKLNKSK